MAWRNFKTGKQTGITSYGVQWRTGSGREASKDSATCDTAADADILIAIMSGRTALPDADTLRKHGLDYLTPPPPETLDRATMSLGQAIADTLDAPDRANAQTNAKYRRMIDLYIEPYFDARPVGGIVRADLRQWQAWMQTDLGLSWATAARVRASVLTKTFKRLTAAGEYGEAPVLPYNPLVGLRAPSGEPYEPPFLETPEQAALLVRAAYRIDATRRTGDAVATLLATGLRFGELAGLTPAANITAKSVIRMRQVAACENGSYRLRPAGKSVAAKRRLPYTVTTGAILDRCAAGLAPSALLFAAPLGGVMQHNNFHSRVWRPALAAALDDGLGVPDLTPHGLRHSTLTALGERGIDHVTLRAYAGHFTPRDVTDRYLHATDRNADAIRAALDDFLADAFAEVPV